jgi:hypothetical protein
LCKNHLIFGLSKKSHQLATFLLQDFKFLSYDSFDLPKKMQKSITQNRNAGIFGRIFAGELKPMSSIIKGLSAGLLLAAAVSIQAQVPPAATPQGAITIHEYRPTGGDIASLTNLATFPNSPDYTDYSPRFEWPTTVDGAPPPGDSGKNNYGVQIIGYFYPPTSGNYTFAIASDDAGRLFLSTDSTPANKRLIAQEGVWNGVRAFDNPEGVDRRRTIVDTTTGRAENVSLPIALTANTPYYIEALMAEGNGGDSLAVTYTTDGSFPLDGAEPIPGDQLRSWDKADGPLVATTVPQSQTVAAGSAVTFRVGIPNGTPPYTYEWLRDGEVVTDPNTGLPIAGREYSLPRVEITDNQAKISVRISNAAGSTITTPEATLTVVNDTTAPTMAKVMSSDTFNQVIVTYSEPMNDQAAIAANYTISGGVTVTGAEFQQFDLLDPSAVTNFVVVRLTTSTQPQNTPLTLTVNATNVKDLFNNSLNPATANFRTFEFRTGVVLYKRWNNINSLQTLTNEPTNLDSPTVIETRTMVETGGDFVDNFTAQMKGYFIPATSGEYVFYGAADDNMLMFLSTDDDPANAHLILADVGWQNNREWTGIGSASTTGNGVDVAYVYRRGQVNDADPFGPWVGPFENRSDQFLTSARYSSTFTAYTPWPTVDGNGNAQITLQAGERYYFEVFHQEGTGGDRAQVTFKAPGETADPANGDASRMTGNLIGAVVDVSSFPPVITQAPTNSYIYNKGDTLTFSVTADNPAQGDLTYQWYLNKKAIEGATSATLTVSNADLEDIGDYSVDVRNVNGVTSSRPDDGARAIMRGAFVIEAEDYNYNRGQTVAGASTMPLATNYYGGLDGIPGVDFKLTNQSTTDAAANGNDYRNGFAFNGVTTPFATTPEDALGNVDVVDNNGDRNRGDFTLETNYKIGWGTAGEWFQYTRNLPPGQYNAVIGASRDGLTTNGMSFALDIVTAGADTTNATVVPIGTVTTSHTGGWSSNDLLPVRASNGSLATYDLGANSTLRLTIVTSDPDLDYILLYPVGTIVEGPDISVSRNASGQPVITFEGTLTGSDSVNGTYSPVAGATSPYEVPTTGSMRFFRALQP